MRITGLSERPAARPPRPYRAAGYPLVPAVFLAGTVAMMANALLERPAATLLGAAIAAAGAPVYFVWRAASRRGPAQPST